MTTDLITNMAFDIIIDVATKRKSKKQPIQKTNNLIFCKYCRRSQLDCNITSFVKPCICSNYACTPCLKRQIELKKCLYCEICSNEYVIVSDIDIDEEINNKFSDHMFIENYGKQLTESNASINSYELITKNKKRHNQYQSQVLLAQMKQCNIQQTYHNNDIAECECCCVLL